MLVPCQRMKTIKYQMSDQKTTQTTGTHKKKLAEYSREEQAIIRWLEKDLGRELTEQEVHLALEQARHLGHL